MRLHARLTGLGLAAALLGELMLAERIAVHKVQGETRLQAGAPRQGEGAGAGHPEHGRDMVTRAVLDHIVAEPSHPFRTWLQFIARTAHADIATRMTAAGLLRPQRMRLSSRYLPVDANQAAWPVGRLNLAVRRREPLNTQDRVLLGLLVATGVGRHVLWEHNAAYLAQSAAGLTAPLQELLAQTEAAVGDAVISRR
ncbi:hypothetical protein Ssi03_69830 [Sphaerisporangium siamense]|uniref:GPP34 family phosphoprotein n=2 Tax=Sphaerisporangium siamense TaxID=795645 RepID=A0A7W7D8U9_9ACTN|nr:hypothetical protein [Sphaerisporangium siamense]GII88993.1 hypothetical protein Ssi03_69830 [Sphaerisporangium siamense]